MLPHTEHLLPSHYSGGVAGTQPLAFVGKGITFDSGGISLKPGAVRTPSLPIYDMKLTFNCISEDEIDAWRHGYMLPGALFVHPLTSCHVQVAPQPLSHLHLPLLN
jgi:hypothetical protein